MATRNRHKLREFSELLGQNFALFGMDTLPDVPHIEENGESFEANACLKAEFTSKYTFDWVLADDSGLEVDALHGAPGVFSARFAGENATDAENRSLLLKQLKGIAPPRRTARLQCVLALAKAGKTIHTASGTVEGTIIKNTRGKEGFGYDPIFCPIGYSKTFAQLTLNIKNKISHRSQALHTLFQMWKPPH